MSTTQLPEVISVRLPATARTELERRAEQFGGRAGQLARKLILDGLQKADASAQP